MAERGVLWEACKKAGILYGRRVEGGFSYHDLRHTFTTDMRRAGFPWTVTASICGHSAGSNMNMMYDAVEDMDKLEAIRQLDTYRKLASVPPNDTQAILSGD